MPFSSCSIGPNMKDLIAVARTTTKPDMVDPLPVRYRTSIAERAKWDQRELESRLNLTLPAAQVELWNNAASLRLFEDVDYGQWGLVMLTWERAIEMTELQMDTRSGQMAVGDLVVGEFLGDSDLLLLRC